MSTGLWVSISAAVITLFGGVIVALIARGKARENQFIDQLQEELGTMRIERERSSRRDRILQNYIYQLNKHIVAGLGPPPPPWPEELFKED